MARLSIGIVCFLSWASAEYTAPSADQVNAIKDIIKAALKEDKDHLPTVVRLGFHDCVGDACDGCINLDNGANNGLADVIDFLEDIYEDNSLSDVMTRADFWQLASNAATEYGITKSNRKDYTDAMPTSPMVFRWGRTDCDNSPSTDDTHEFPEPTMSRTEMMDYFNQHYGFSEDEVTALMGAHTLGNAATDASGYRGAWIGGQTTDFNNVYYQFLTGAGVVFENAAIDRRDSDENGDRKWQWQMEDSEGEGLGMMLNTDMELYYDIDVDADKGTTTCSIVATDDLPACSRSATADLVDLYATDTNAFWEAYKSVYDKLSSHGYTSLEEIDLA